jgi:hypothetical protein
MLSLGERVLTPAVAWTLLQRIVRDKLATADFVREPLPYEAGFLAGKAFLTYRRRGGTGRSPNARLLRGSARKRAVAP